MEQKQRDLIVGFFYAFVFITGFAQVLFIVLKLLKVIDWNWFCVFFPYIVFAVVLVLIPVVSKFHDKKQKMHHRERENLEN